MRSHPTAIATRRRSMGTFLSSAWRVAALAQGSAGGGRQADSVRQGVATRADDGPAQLALGREYLARFDEYHGHGVRGDTVVALELLDTADEVLTRAALALG